MSVSQCKQSLSHTWCKIIAKQEWQLPKCMCSVLTKVLSEDNAESDIKKKEKKQDRDYISLRFLGENDFAILNIYHNLPCCLLQLIRLMVHGLKKFEIIVLYRYGRVRSELLFCRR